MNNKPKFEEGDRVWGVGNDNVLVFGMVSTVVPYKESFVYSIDIDDANELAIFSEDELTSMFDKIKYAMIELVKL